MAATTTDGRAKTADGAGRRDLAPVCRACHGPLQLSIGYTGCDWTTTAGDGSGFGHEIALECPVCNRIYPLVAVRETSDFAPMKAAYRNHTMKGNTDEASEFQESSVRIIRLFAKVTGAVAPI